METSLFLAKAFGLYLVIIALPLLLDYSRAQSVIIEYLNNRALCFFTGIMALILGIILILTHNVWAWDWRVLITLLAWATFSKGILWLYFPVLAKQITIFYKSKNAFIVSAMMSLAIGICLLYHGFYLNY